MAGDIILITNRGVRPSRKGATLFKNRMTTSPHRLRCAAVTEGSRKGKYRLALVDQGDERQFIMDAVASDNDKPWVFFIHGNNQTLDKNLKKCFELRKLYDVNVLAFSWPSVHHGKIRAILNYIPRQPNVLIYGSRQLKNKLKQYKKAKKNAVSSAPDLSAALNIAEDAFHAANVKAHFVSHSLGAFVLENSHKHQNLKDSLSYFDNVIVHQADADNDGHREWVDAIEKGDSVVVTTNKHDKVLEVSNIYNHQSLHNQRLGNVPKQTESGSPAYKDFTGMKKLGFSGHTIFLTSPDKNSDVYSYFAEKFA